MKQLLAILLLGIAAAPTFAADKPKLFDDATKKSLISACAVDLPRVDKQNQAAAVTMPESEYMRYCTCMFDVTQRESAVSPFTANEWQILAHYLRQRGDANFDAKLFFPGNLTPEKAEAMDAFANFYPMGVMKPQVAACINNGASGQKQ